MAAERVSEFRGRSEERARLDQVLEEARAGQSAVLVVRGEAGIGKTALLKDAATRAGVFRVAQIAGVESQMELAYAGLHQLCAPMLDRLDVLPEPQQTALTVALGLASGDPPDRFLVALAALGLMSAVAEEQPLLCMVDDFQWLDEASGPALEFVARRLLAEPVALVFAVREPSAQRHLVGLPELPLAGLGDADARALLETVVPGLVDERVRDRIVGETRGNPLALLELPRAISADELAGGFALPARGGLSGSIEDGFLRRLDALPADTRRLLQLAAADPVGDPLLLWRAAEHLGIHSDAALPAIDADLVEIRAQVRFRHPLVRSAAYRSASPAERHALHAALAEATDPELDPDRYAWHRAQAAPGPDETVAEALERSAARAEARGGAAAAAAFLESAATLTPDPADRVRRLLAAARAKRDAGAVDVALQLLDAAESGPMSALQAAEIERLRGQAAWDQFRVRDAAQLLADAAVRLDGHDPGLARRTHLEALGAAMWHGDLARPGSLLATAEAARAAPPAPDPAGAVDVVLDALVLRLTEGYAAAAPALEQALETVLELKAPEGDLGRWLWLTGARAAGLIAIELWDADAMHELSSRQVRVARECGALVQLQFALQFHIRSQLAAGELNDVGVRIEEARVIAQATGRSTGEEFEEALLAAWRGQESRAAGLLDRMVDEATAAGLGGWVEVATTARALLYNGAGHYEAARDVARLEFAHREHVAGGPFIVAELAEAASRTGDRVLVEGALEWLSGRTAVTRNDWVLGTEARVRALLGEADAEDQYIESIACLGRTRLRPELARSHLLYGEWLRREGRRVDAREQLRTAHDLFAAMGMEGFAERARHELLATGEKVRKRRDDTRGELTPQEEHIARLALDGQTNPEIGAELFISPRTVEWHLKNVYLKLGITSRKGLREVLPARGHAVAAT